MGLVDEESCGCGTADNEGEDLCGGEGTFHLTDSGIAAQELGLPPQQRGMRNGGGLDGLGPRCLEGVSKEYLLVALWASLDVGAQLGITGIGPVSLEEHGFDLGVVRAGLHAGLRWIA